VYHYGGLDCHIVLGKARNMFFSVKEFFLSFSFYLLPYFSLSLSLSLSFSLCLFLFLARFLFLLKFRPLVIAHDLSYAVSLHERYNSEHSQISVSRRMLLPNFQSFINRFAI